jgi:hypothetical protein
MAIAKRISDPATAKDSIVTPKSLRMVSPRIRKPTIMQKEAKLVRAALSSPADSLIFNIIGTEPTTSITANRTVVVLNNSPQLNPIKKSIIVFEVLFVQ